jgi:hypothetical protein
MKTIIVSYSLTGNNDALAAAAAQALAADHIRITGPKQRKTGVILLDRMFGRTPRTQPSPEVLSGYERILFVAPVWMGIAASPLRACLAYLKKHPKTYAFASISGGALGVNTKLLEKRTGLKPAAVIDQHIAALLPQEAKPTTKDTSGYRINAAETARLCDMLVGILQEICGF